MEQWCALLRRVLFDVASFGWDQCKVIVFLRKSQVILQMEIGAAQSVILKILGVGLSKSFGTLTELSTSNRVRLIVVNHLRQLLFA